MTLNFDRSASLNEQSNVDESYCVFCRSNVTQFTCKDDELLCKTCGFVLKTNISWVDTPVVTNTSVALDMNTTQSLMNISTFKDGYGKYVNYSVANALKKTIQRNKINTTYNRTKVKGKLQIDRMARQLNLSTALYEQVIQTFDDFNIKGYLRNRNIYSVVAAIISIVASSNNVPLPIIQILKKGLTTKKKFNVDYFYIYHKFNTAKPLCAKIKAHYQRYMSFIEQFDNRANLKLQLDKIMDVLDIFKMDGREGVVTVGTLIYVLSKYWQYPKCDQLLKLLVINRLTLKNCWIRLSKKYEFLNRYKGFERKNII